VYTIIETPVFAKQAEVLLDGDQRESFAAYVALNPFVGVVIPGSGGVRKLRWGTTGSGKRGGFRIIYFNRLDQGQIWLLTIFSKGQQSTISTRVLRQIRKAIHDGN
jgi:mRNA-degrading endonuclease RelE of RelBE toxin-antitoxin system